MKKETIKTIGNTLLYAGVTGLAVWKTWEAWSLKRSMKFYAESLREAIDLIKEAGRRVLDVRFPEDDRINENEKDAHLRKAELDLADSCGIIEFVIDSIDAATSD